MFYRSKCTLAGLCDKGCASQSWNQIFVVTSLLLDSLQDQLDNVWSNSFCQDISPVPLSPFPYSCEVGFLP